MAQAGDLASVVDDPQEAAAGAHALYTDVWVSMGDEDDASRRRELLAPYRLDAGLLAHARDDAVVLHCLPAHPGEEITEDLLYGERSAVWDQAENRLHAQKALMERLLADVPRTRREPPPELPRRCRPRLALLACLALGGQRPVHGEEQHGHHGHEQDVGEPDRSHVAARSHRVGERTSPTRPASTGAASARSACRSTSARRS